MNLRCILVLASALLPLTAGTLAARTTGSICASPCKAAPAGSGPLFVFSGHGWGHGVGMSQYGAYGYAEHGWTHQQILAHYFPGTTLGPAGVTRLRVLLAKKKALTISSDADFAVKDGTGAAHQVPAGSYKLGPDLKLKLGTGPAAALPAPLTFTPGTEPLLLRRPYRGSIQVDAVDGKVRAIDIVGLEQYLYGVVPAEMPSNWAPEALEAQAVVARSYALASRNVAAPFDVYPDSRSQVYLGISQEKPSTTAAVDATAGQVVLYGGKVARTYFFSTSGGRTENGGDVWSDAAGLSYLVSVPDPYDVVSPYHDWGPVPVTGRKLAKAFGIPGVDDARRTLDSAGRVASLALSAPSANELSVPGTTVRSKLGLRSTWFDVGMLSLASPPATTLVYGGAVRLTGVDRHVDGVSLEQRPAGSSWQPARSVAPAPDGAFSFTAKPSVSTLYRLATPSFAAAPVRIAVAPRVRFAAGAAPGQLIGSVLPALEGAQVQIQRRDDSTGTWTTVATGTTDAGGDFAVSLGLTAGVYRARVAPGRGFVAGTTPPLRIGSG